LKFIGDSGNIRRSQRQQDRIERQEAERILAENQQMLQREKEIMKEKEVHAQAVTSSSSSPIASSPVPRLVPVVPPVAAVVQSPSPQVQMTPPISSPRGSIDSVDSEK